MKNFKLGDSEVLVVKQNGKISALGAKCTHFNLPLSSAVVGNGRIRCPWHGACFSLATGDIEDYPGQDSLPCYQVNIEEGQVKVRAKKSELKSGRRTQNFIKRDATDKRTFVVIGGGPSGAICAETLRIKGFTGRIVIIAKESILPYDRVILSKFMAAPVERLVLKSQEFYDEREIEVMTGVAVTVLNTDIKEISLDNGSKVNYDKVYIATGLAARKCKIFRKYFFFY